MKARLVREALDFERGGNPMKQLGIGIITWDKLSPGDILQNKKIVYPEESRLFFDITEKSLEVLPDKYWIINEIFRVKKDELEEPDESDADEYLNLSLNWAGIFRHAEAQAERIKNPNQNPNVFKSFPKMYTAMYPIERWDEYFRIIQPKEYDHES